MKKPRIGIAPQFDYDNGWLRVDPCYMDALYACGALPLLLPLIDDTADIETLADLCDGYLFPGGPDFLPALFGEEPLPGCGRIDDRRDALEFPLLRAVLAKKKPVFGICRGEQLIDVALGGSIWQDLPSQLPGVLLHDQQRPYDAPVHRVTIVPDTLLSDIVGERALMVNSLHHQAVRDVPEGLIAAAHTADGVVEAVCGKPGMPFLLGVQWHPEKLFAKQPHARALFQAFVDACK